MEQAVTKKELHILMLEDTPSDAQLIERELHKAGIAFTAQRVDTREAFIRALDEFHPDIILSDYKLPSFDGMSALQIVQSDYPEVPVIMVTGALPDIEAVELIHAGAKDYVLKDRLARLAPAVHRALSMEQGIRIRKQAEERMRLAAQVFESTLEGIMITDADRNIVEVNKAFTQITGYPREEVLGRNPNLLKSTHHGGEFYTMMWASINSTGHWVGEIWNRRKNGEAYPEALTISTVVNKQGQISNYVGIFSDITLFKQHEKQLERTAHYDALTGIPNRVLLADRMKQALAHSKRNRSLLAVCYLDLDGFKLINDMMGHEAGDKILVEIAKRIEHTIRGGDTVARLGGDEFVILLVGIEQREECTHSLARLLEVISQPIQVGGRSFTLSASIGVALYLGDNEDEDVDALLRHADQAMYSAKQAGKNRYYLYDPAHDQRTRAHQALLGQIIYGLSHGQFELHYQPKVEMHSRRLVGAEALIRWRHPERGLLSPGEFLQVVYGTELEIGMGEWVIAAALEQLRSWHQSGLALELSINISAFHLQSAEFPEKLRQRMAAYPDLPAGSLQIEILETAALEDVSNTTAIIEACRSIGVSFALDDFGTGYSSLSYLSNLPVNTLKIDQSFVRDMLEDKGDRAIVQGIIALAHAFEREIVAEGIETEDIYQALLEMGCEIGQGYGIARPMPPEEFLRWHST